MKKINIIIFILLCSYLLNGSSQNNKVLDTWFKDDSYCELSKEYQGKIIEDKINIDSYYPYTFKVYLPYNYNLESKYNVLIFFTTVKGTGNDFMSKYWSTWYAPSFKFSNIYDNMIYQQICEPFIIIAPDYLNWWDKPVSYENIAQTTRNYLIPYIINNYSTYAKSDSIEDMIEAREHFAIGGASLGGMYVFGGLMETCLDVCANYCPMSAFIDYPYQLDNTLINIKYPIKTFCYTQGELEREDMDKTYLHLINNFPKIFTNENTFFYQIKNSHHYYHTWGIGIWNSCQQMWPEKNIFDFFKKI